MAQRFSRVALALFLGLAVVASFPGPANAEASVDVYSLNVYCL